MLHSTVSATYACLSYRWGSPDTVQEILLNGTIFFIRQNLFDYLSIAQKKVALSNLAKQHDANKSSHRTGSKRPHQVDANDETRSTKVARVEIPSKGNIRESINWSEAFDITKLLWIDALS